jgi:hypothetical protein
MTDQECPCVLAAGQPGVEHTRTQRHAPPGPGGSMQMALTGNSLLGRKGGRSAKSSTNRKSAYLQT